ncbi:DNA processing protein [Acetanaerobacterium elongatum]|uniref:DNA processing protein n=2 Tax=Acetanaerobacterium elongatum TaxID=258515 RepID=A0A1H0DL25_9FIRM|nr:DNA processing protein [Acetanaerobacterium elongatum]
MTEYCIWLQQCFGEGSVKPYNIIKQYGSAKAFYDSVQAGLSGVHDLLPADIARVKNTPLELAQKILEKCTQKGIDVYTIDHALYPEKLKNIYAPPVVLYGIGMLPELDRLVAIAVVGNRRMSDYGGSVARQIGYDLARAGAVVVSGLALGIDACGHEGALLAGGKTVAVLGCGPDVIYPSENEALTEQIRSKGTILSEFPPGTRPIARNFPIRNRIISGLCNGIAVIEAGVKSGSLITANLALEQGRDIFTVPNSIYCEHSAGSLRLLRDGAIPIGSAYDILIEYEGLFKDKLNLEKIPRCYYYLPAQHQKSALPAQKKASKPRPEQPPILTVPGNPKAEAQSLPDYLTGQAVKVYDILRTKTEKTHVDEIAVQTGLSTPEVLSAITELEIEELVRAYPGRRYSV